MADVELTRALERGEIANGNFRHASHLHVAWVYLSESASLEEAAGKMREALRRFATAAGKAEKYHETITLFWVRLLGLAQACQCGRSLEEIVHAHPQLLEKDFPLAYYSRKRLFSEEARRQWMEPDLRPLLIDATSPCSSGSPRDPSHRALPR